MFQTDCFRRTDQILIQTDTHVPGHVLFIPLVFIPNLPCKCIYHTYLRTCAHRHTDSRYGPIPSVGLTGCLAKGLISKNF